MGIGVGLSCSKAIANSLGGDVFVLSSKEDEGTIIRTYIPAKFNRQERDYKEPQANQFLRLEITKELVDLIGFEEIIEKGAMSDSNYGEYTNMNTLQVPKCKTLKLNRWASIKPR